LGGASGAPNRVSTLSLAARRYDDGFRVASQFGKRALHTQPRGSDMLKAAVASAGRWNCAAARCAASRSTGF